MAAPTTVLVTHLTGQAWTRGTDGTLTPIREGMRIPADAEIVTATGANLQVQADGMPPVTIGEGQDIALTADLVSPPQSSEAAVTPPTDAAVDQVIQAINAGQDPLAQLDPTAATLAGGDGGEHSFVRLSSVIELTTPLALSYPLGTPGDETALLHPAVATVTEAAPPVEPPAPPVEPPAPPVEPPSPPVEPPAPPVEPPTPPVEPPAPPVEPPPPPVEPPPPPVEPPPPPVEPPPPPPPTPLSYNIALLIDISASMGETAPGTNKTRMELTKDALHDLVHTLSGYEGQVNVGLMSFSTGADTVHTVTGLNSGDVAGNLAALLGAIDGLTPDGATNYEAAFTQAAGWFAGQGNNFQNVTYFVTDGNPTVYNGDTTYFAGVTDYRDMQGALDAFATLTSDGGKVHAIGVGDDVNEAYLKFFDNTNTVGTESLTLSDRTKDSEGHTQTGTGTVEGDVGQPTFVNGPFQIDAPPQTAAAPHPPMTMSLAGLVDDGDALAPDVTLAGQGKDDGHDATPDAAPPANSQVLGLADVLDSGAHPDDVPQLLGASAGPTVGTGDAGGASSTGSGAGGAGDGGGAPRVLGAPGDTSIADGAGSVGDMIQSVIDQGKHGMDHS